MYFRTMTAAALTAFFAATVSAAAQPAAPPATQTPPGHPRCFYPNEFEGWKAPDDRTIYLRIRIHRIYRLDLSSPCAGLRWPDAHLIMNVRGSDTICTPLDWDLKVASSPPSIAEACIVKTMTELSPAEADAIPKKYQP